MGQVSGNTGPTEIGDKMTRLDLVLKREAKIKAIREDKILSEVIRALLRAWVEGKIELPEPEQGGESQED